MLEYRLVALSIIEKPEDHRALKPQPPRKDPSEESARARIAWREWHDDKKALDEALDMLQYRLKRLNSLSFKLKGFWASLFGG